MSRLYEYLEMAVGPDKIGTRSMVKQVADKMEKEIDSIIERGKGDVFDFVLYSDNFIKSNLDKHVFKQQDKEIVNILKENYEQVGWNVSIESKDISMFNKDYPISPVLVLSKK